MTFPAYAAPSNLTRGVDATSGRSGVLAVGARADARDIATEIATEAGPGGTIEARWRCSNGPLLIWEVAEGEGFEPSMEKAPIAVSQQGVLSV